MAVAALDSLVNRLWRGNSRSSSRRRSRNRRSRTSSNAVSNTSFASDFGYGVSRPFVWGYKVAEFGVKTGITAGYLGYKGLEKLVVGGTRAAIATPGAIRAAPGAMYRKAGRALKATKNAIRKSPRFALDTLAATPRAIYTGLNTARKAAWEGVVAANPLKDIKNFFEAGYNLCTTKPSWQNYKKHLKEWNILGDGDLAKVLFYSALAINPLAYPFLAGIRFATAAGAYTGKEIATSDKVRPGLAKFINKHKKKISLVGAPFGVDRRSIESKLSRASVDRALRTLKDDKVFREHMYPIAIHTAIGLKGYGGLVGGAYLTWLTSKTANKISNNSRWGPVRWLSGKVGKYSGKTSNLLANLVPISMLANGFPDHRGFKLTELVKGEYNDDIREGVHAAAEDIKGKYDYVASGEILTDAKDYVTDELLGDSWDVACAGAGLAKDGIVKGAGMAWDGTKYVFTGPMVQDVKDVAEATANTYKYVRSGEVFADLGNFVTNDIPQIALNAAKDLAWDALEVVGLDQEERYAVIACGFDYDPRCGPFGMFQRSNPNWFLTESCKVYNDLLEMGFKPENIKVLSPNDLDRAGHHVTSLPGYEKFEDAFDDNSYDHDATERNLAKVIKDVGSQVDGNDVFMLYVTTHGNTTGGIWDDSEPMSYFMLDCGDERVTEKELDKMVDCIQAGREFYIVEACHSGTFARIADGPNEEAIGVSRRDQVAYSDRYGNSLGRYFIKELKLAGMEKGKSDEEIKDILKKSLDKWRRDDGIGSHRYTQKPQYGSGGVVEEINTRRAA